MEAFFVPAGLPLRSDSRLCSSYIESGALRGVLDATQLAHVIPHDMLACHRKQPVIAARYLQELAVWMPSWTQWCPAKEEGHHCTLFSSSHDCSSAMFPLSCKA